MADQLTLENLARALIAHRLAGLEDVWSLSFADVRRAAAILEPHTGPAAPRPDDLAALMRAFPYTKKENQHG